MSALDMYPDILQQAGRLFRVEDYPEFSRLLSDYKADPCEPHALCMRELAAMEKDSLVWLFILALAFNLQVPAK